jgi:hypothetical protein
LCWGLLLLLLLLALGVLPLLLLNQRDPLKHPL